MRVLALHMTIRMTIMCGLCIALFVSVWQLNGVIAAMSSAYAVNRASEKDVFGAVIYALIGVLQFISACG